ncbi:diacylglycerol O-acyltransferase [Coprinopsis cinerea okayama7|uniref:Diacylglycerol O-acyltransferase n=1 Tax=Coprinopsis cinerea (strain Okayama-7 / 130 / ATCC MYA-4618 / FGSC 9003) TaxID=240176 RepID=A8N8M1_COPC7|nr:diacylglycerol O-acyltransferase [Coprinopsis cinerea okayama7\|eukprot:XP_001831177.2 diacylglycerol O-acyltransferase [Coprinopsis cinerea okayama7\
MGNEEKFGNGGVGLDSSTRQEGLRLRVQGEKQQTLHPGPAPKESNSQRSEETQPKDPTHTKEQTQSKEQTQTQTQAKEQRDSSSIGRPIQLPRSLSASMLKEKLSKLAEAPMSVGSTVAKSYANVDSFPPLWPFLAAYYIWARWIDQCPERGGRRSHWFQSLKFWKYFADYYPVQLLKEVDLPPDRPYVFGYHPHGIIGMGAVAAFATQSTGFAEAFPGIYPRLLTLATNFQMPFYRDILLALGICSVSRTSCSNILKSGPGSAITIVVGGAAESLSAHPGTADLTLRKRLGFIKVAIQHGADLVPVFSFGENDIYQQMPNEKGTTIYELQKKFQAIFGFTLPLFHGRGLLNYNVGLMPYRRRIVVVVGRPIHVNKCDKPSLEEVYRIQQQYIEELTRIWDTYKDQFAKSRVRELNIIE